MHRHVFHGVHGNIGPPLRKGILELLDEQPLAADLGQRRGELLVPLGRHAQDLDVEPWLELGEPIADVVRLP